jgi:hypothetical protein
MENTRLATEQEVEVLTFLNELRESGEINMFGAAPYIQDIYEVDSREAKRLLVLWMNNFNEEANYETLKTA